MKPFIQRLLLGLFGLLVVILVVAAAGFRLWFHRFLESDPCRLWLSGALSGALHARGELTAVQALPGALYSDGFAAWDGPGFRQVRADQIRAEVRFGFWTRSCAVDHLEAARLLVDLRSPREPAVNNPETPAVFPGAKTSSWTPSHFSLSEATTNDLRIVWPGGEVKGVRVVAHPNGENSAEWLLSAGGGTVRPDWLPSDATGTASGWRLDTAEGRLRAGTLFLTDARLRASDRGEIRLDGEFPQASRAGAHLHAVFSALPVGPWLSPDWRARLSGSLSGQADAHPANGAAPGWEGSAAINLVEGELTALPILDRLAEVTHADGFRRMHLHRASANVARTGDLWTVTRFVAESAGLVRVEGDFTVAAGHIHGTLQVGAAPAALQWVPGARERVFTLSRDGYLWTPVQLSGPVEHPGEDLTARLANAATEQTVQDVRQSVQDGAKSVLDLVKPLLAP